MNVYVDSRLCDPLLADLAIVIAALLSPRLLRYFHNDALSLKTSVRVNNSHSAAAFNASAMFDASDGQKELHVPKRILYNFLQHYHYLAQRPPTDIKTRTDPPRSQRSHQYHRLGPFRGASVKEASAPFRRSLSLNR